MNRRIWGSTSELRYVSISASSVMVDERRTLHSILDWPLHSQTSPTMTSRITDLGFGAGNDHFVGTSDWGWRDLNQPLAIVIGRE